MFLSGGDTMTSNDTLRSQPISDDERRAREASLDHTNENSVPASDPPSTNPNPYEHDRASDAPATAVDDDRLADAKRSRRAGAGGAARGRS
jgi:hypothetical protein